MFDLSVVVPSHNRLSFLPALLESLVIQDYPQDRWELVLVDDGSSDGTAEYLRSGTAPRPANIVVVSQPQSGVSVARNNGVRAAQGRAVLFLDDDMVASPSLVCEHALVHGQDPKAVVTGHLSMPTEEREPWVSWEDVQLERHFVALESGVRVPGPRDFYTGNCSVSVSMFNKVGGFDTSLPRAEDVELGYRLARAGAHFYYRPKADSLHLGRHPFTRWLRNARLYGHCDVVLAWQKEHTHLQVELFRWYRQRNLLNKGLVRACATRPGLERLAIRGLHLAGSAAHNAGAHRIATACYSAIYNLAYWLSILQVVGEKRFWAGVRSKVEGTDISREHHTRTQTGITER